MKRLLYSSIVLAFFAVSSVLAQETGERTEEEMVSVGKEASASVMSGLKKNLSKAIEERGVVGALSFCAEKALPLTHELTAKNIEGLSTKRISDRMRNNENAPDAREEEALKYFEDSPKAKFFVQKGSEGEPFRFYTPIRMKPLCLACHGEYSAMNQELVQTIRKLYPDDKAHGYKEGDFRGLVRVSIAANAEQK